MGLSLHIVANTRQQAIDTKVTEVRHHVRTLQSRMTYYSNKL